MQLTNFFPWWLPLLQIGVVDFFAPLKNHQVCRDDLGGIKLGVPVYRRSDIGWLMSAVVEGGNAL